MTVHHIDARDDRLVHEAHVVADAVAESGPEMRAFVRQSVELGLYTACGGRERWLAATLLTALRGGELP